MNSVLQKKFEQKKALLAFNIQNVYQLSSLHNISLNKGIPVFAQFSAKYIPFFEKLFGLKNLVKKYQNDIFFFHLDHCQDEELIKFCIDSGFASVMFDGSSLPLQENVRRSNLIHQYAASKKSLLEVELGSIKGVEDGFGVDDGGYFSSGDLVYFAQNTNYDMLALAIGNAHGLYSSTEEIKIEKLGEARKLIGSVPFVLHGGTGMPDDMIFEAIDYGVVKINVSTALKIEQTRIAKSFAADCTMYDEMKFLNYYSLQITPFFESLMLKFTL